MKALDLVGDRFGRLVVARRCGSKGGRSAWECVCDCGNIVIIKSDNLKSGHTNSCGCLAREIAGKRFSDMANTIKRPSISERFFAKVSKSEANNCQVWTGTKNDDGYGRFVLKDSTKKGGERYVVAAHRHAWEMANGQIPKGLCVLHKCDNPLCVNVDHLFLGTLCDNNKDRARKFRSADTHGENHPQAKLTEQQVIESRKTNEPLTKIAKRLGIKYGTLWKAAKGVNWKHINDAA